MTRLVLAAIAILAAAPGAGRADLGDSTGVYWGVPGVMNTTNLATLFQCSNPSTTDSHVMAVFVFDGTGSVVGANSALLPPGGSATMSTQTISSLVSTDYVNLGIAPLTTVLGAARVGLKQLICTAWVMSNGTSPGHMNPLPILKTTKQRGQ